MTEKEQERHSEDRGLPPQAYREEGQDLSLASGEGLGAIQCDKSVFHEIAANAALKVEGVASIGGRSSLGGRLGLKERDSGIEIVTSPDANEISVNLAVHVVFGPNIYEVCSELQRCVKNSIESITNYTVNSVNVKVQGLRSQDAPHEEETQCPESESAKSA